MCHKAMESFDDLWPPAPVRESKTKQQLFTTWRRSVAWLCAKGPVPTCLNFAAIFSLRPSYVLAHPFGIQLQVHPENFLLPPDAVQLFLGRLLPLFAGFCRL
jgi:hypothetical protein